MSTETRSLGVSTQLARIISVVKSIQIIKPLWLTVPATFFGTLLIYIVSMPGDLTWSYFGGDGGELITASVTLGIPHPPGYPTYVLLGKLMSYLPSGTLASRYHLLSAISMSVAAAFVAQVTLEFKKRYQKESGQITKSIFLPGVATGLLFAFLPLVWSQAVIAEVYALNLAFLGGMIWLLVSGRSPLLVGILFGLSVTTHITSLLMLPLCLLLLPKNEWHRFTIGSFLGLAPILFLIILANGTSPIIWGRPDDLRDWLWLVSGRLYTPNVFGLAAAGWLARIQSWFPLLLAPLALLFISMSQILTSKEWPAVRRIVTILLLTALVYTAYAFGYSTRDAAVLLLPALLILSMVAGLGITRTGRYSLFLVILMFSYGSYYLSSERSPPIRPSYEHVLSLVPPEAIIITPGDQTVAATWYFAYAEEQRLDIIVVDNNLFQFSWYRDHLAEVHPKLKHLNDDDLPTFIRANSRQFSICRLSMVDELDFNCENPKI